MLKGRASARLAAGAYWALLTLFLLVPDPAALIGLERPPAAGGRGLHFVLFAVLAVLFSFARWPVRRATLAGAMVFYALAIESLQALVPIRTVEALDYAENLLGLAVGMVLCWRFYCPAGR